MRRTVISRLTVLAVTMLGMLALASPAWAATFTVDRGDDPIPVAGAGACTSAAGDCSLRGAIEKSNINGQTDTVVFAVRGTITLQNALTVANDTLAEDLRINGPGQEVLTVRQSPDVLLRVLQIVGKTTINGITISGGRSPNSAGGILNNGGAVLTLNDTTVTDNQALGTVANSGYGGGIYNADGATLTLNRSTVSLNKANSTGDGGGISNFGGTVTLNDSTVSGNEANDNHGGGIYNEAGAVTLNRSTVANNKAGSGGGILSRLDLAVADEKTTVTNSTITGNAASTSGGGIYNFGGLTKIENSTITLNTAPSGAGSGVASYGDFFTSTEVLSTIISANTNTDVDFVPGTANSFSSRGFNLIGDGNATDAFNKSGDQIVVDPRLGGLANNGGPTATHAVLKGSRAIDRGAASGCPKTDQRGTRRPQNGDGKGTSRCDVGAYEKKAVRR